MFYRSLDSHYDRGVDVEAFVFHASNAQSSANQAIADANTANVAIRTQAGLAAAAEEDAEAAASSAHSVRTIDTVDVNDPNTLEGYFAQCETYTSNAGEASTTAADAAEEAAFLITTDLANAINAHQTASTAIADALADAQAIVNEFNEFEIADLGAYERALDALFAIQAIQATIDSNNGQLDNSNAEAVLNVQGAQESADTALAAMTEA